MSCHDTVAIELLLVETEVSTAVSHKLVVFDEGTAVKEKFDALTGCQLVALMLLVNAVLSTAKQGLGANLLEPLYERLISH